ncbi:MAG: glycosyltransferase [Candidatus Omnitrophota bacterium]|nr:glycosyltransferase [Candidatus Omnitrophota bacterium]
MKILFVGQIALGQTSHMRLDALRELGHTVTGIDSQAGWSKCGYLSRHAQQFLERGSAVECVTNQVRAIVRETKPDLLWCEKQEYIGADIIRELKSKGLKTLHYTPDPLLSLKWKQTKTLRGALPLYDYLVTSKRYELASYASVGNRVLYMPLGFCEKVHRPFLPAKRTTMEKYQSQLSFVGGWEPRRENLLRQIVDAGHCLKIWGYGWNHVLDGVWTPRRYLRMSRLAGTAAVMINKDERLGRCVQDGEIYGDEYAWALSAAAIGIGFLRSVCPDEHTTRTFEIPATASMLLADRTDEHCDFFEEGKEAEFFSSSEELLEKVAYYLSHDREREKIACRGYERCRSSGYSYRERLSKVLKEIGIAGYKE